MIKIGKKIKLKNNKTIIPYAILNGEVYYIDENKNKFSINKSELEKQILKYKKLKIVRVEEKVLKNEESKRTNNNKFVVNNDSNEKIIEDESYI